MVISKKTIHDVSFSSCPLTISSIKIWNAENVMRHVVKTRPRREFKYVKNWNVITTYVITGVYNALLGF